MLTIKDLHSICASIQCKVQLPILVCVMLQLTKQLFEHVWSQWCCDTQHMAGSLPQALAAQAPGQPLLLSLERWLILLKVRVTLLC